MITLRKPVDTGISKTKTGKPNSAEGVAVQDLQPDLELALFQLKQLAQRITQQQERVAGLRATGASSDHPEDLLRILQRSHESLRRFLLRVAAAGKT